MNWEQAFEVLENESADAVQVDQDTGEAQVFFRGEWVPFEDYAHEWSTLELPKNVDVPLYWNHQTLQWEELE